MARKEQDKHCNHDYVIDRTRMQERRTTRNRAYGDGAAL